MFTCNGSFSTQWLKWGIIYLILVRRLLYKFQLPIMHSNTVSNIFTNTLDPSPAPMLSSSFLIPKLPLCFIFHVILDS